MRRSVLFLLVSLFVLVPATAVAAEGHTGVVTANGWYEGEEIYYIAHRVEEGVTERGQNDIYLIGGDRLYQAQVVEFIPGEPGYSPHWNVNVVHPIISEEGAEAPGNSELPEEFPPFPDTF